MEPGYITVIILTALNQLTLFGLIAFMLWERRNLAKKIKEHQIKVFEDYREKR